MYIFHTLQGSKLSIKENKGFGIYLILTINYIDFNITIYPLDIESFTYDNVLVPNNLGSINFENYFSEYIDYEIDNNQIILVILLESLSLNSSINELNYYFYALTILKRRVKSHLLFLQSFLLQQ